MDNTSITILDVARARGAHEEDGSINAGEFIRLGLPFFGGCLNCGATLGPYNSFPSTTGYIMCQDCLGDAGFSTIDQFEQFDPTNW